MSKLLTLLEPISTLRFFSLGGSFLAVALLSACSGGQTPPAGNSSGGMVSLDDCMNESASIVSSGYSGADPITGGLLYDKWWDVINGAAEPTTDHPLWATKDAASKNSSTGSGTWRCKECHGWDYKGKDGAYGTGDKFTGFPGVVASATKPEVEVFCAIKAGTDHSFGTDRGDGQPMTDTDILNLTKFVREATLAADDINMYIDIASKQAQGSVPDGEVHYTTDGQCINCHGAEGNQQLDSDETVGILSAKNPWELLHKIRFGQPGSIMPSGIENGLDLQAAVDIIAYAQATFPGGQSTGGGTLGGGSGDKILGGLLYDNWAKETGKTPPAEPNPQWTGAPAGGADAPSAADTWRCKQCHGWDYKGKDGVYGSPGKNFSGAVGILAAQSKSTEELTAVLQNGKSFTNVSTGEPMTVHDYGARGLLSENEIAALVAFIKEGVIDTNLYISPDGQSIYGVSHPNGEQLYAFDRTKAGRNGDCSLCHGSDGRLIDFADGNPAVPPNEFLGDLAFENPWEVLHKIRFGQPGIEGSNAGEMPSLLASGLTDKDAADILAHSTALRLRAAATRR